MIAYYNEIDPEAAAWLRELIRRDLIAPGDVDERDIRDVLPVELSRYRQCHFFAGVGVWSYALRRAGWDDERPVWTGSCPCQSFSAAGQRKGFADERHLWPSWFHLISQCRPPVIFGEQVASSDSAAWLDLVHTDLEALGYAVGPVVLPAAGFGAPHGRHRIYFVADAEESGRRAGGPGQASRRRDTPRIEPDRLCEVGGMADSSRERWKRRKGTKEGREHDGATSGWIESDDGPISLRETGPIEYGPPGPTSGFWGDADWLRCTDWKWRAVRPGSFPLAHGDTTRVVRLRGYGNGLASPVAEAFIKAYLGSE